MIHAAEIVETTKTVVCSTPEAVFATLTGEDHKEVPIWIANVSDKKSQYSIFVNQKNKTWTIVQFNEKVACIIGTGDSYKFSPEMFGRPS
jgi:hypothetical protein